MWVWSYWGIVYLSYLLFLFGLAMLFSKMKVPTKRIKLQTTMLGSNLNNLHIKVSTYKHEAIVRKLENLPK